MEKLRKRIRSRYFRKAVIYFLTCCMVLNTSLPVALAEVVLQSEINGTINVSPLGEGITHQNMIVSDGAIGHFSDFDIAASHTVSCVQTGPNPDALFSALFKVYSGDGTQILGQFDANGNIFLIDSAGILFGANSQVNVNKLFASTLDIDDISGDNYEFIAGAEVGEVLNYGEINAVKGAALIGSRVLNYGTITTDPGGFVVMAAGDRVLLGEPGSKIVVEMDSVTRMKTWASQLPEEQSFLLPATSFRRRSIPIRYELKAALAALYRTAILMSTASMAEVLL